VTSIITMNSVVVPAEEDAVTGAAAVGGSAASSRRASCGCAADVNPELRRESLGGLVGGLLDGSRASENDGSVLPDAGKACERFLSQHGGGDGAAAADVSRALPPPPPSSIEQALTGRTLAAAAVFQRIAFASKMENRRQLEARELLQVTADQLLEEEDSDRGDSLARFLSLSLVVAALALRCDDGACDVCRGVRRSVASAIESTVQSRLEEGDALIPTLRAMAEAVVRGLLLAAAPNKEGLGCTVDLHIVATLARAYGVVSCTDKATCEACASAIRRVVLLYAEDWDDDGPDVQGDPDSSRSIRKIEVAGALTLASQLRPWENILPAQLVETAVQFGLWHAADSVCVSAVAVAETSIAKARATMAVNALVDAAMDARTYRLADRYATKFYDSGGHARFLEARFMHACGTIAKLVQKRALPVIERQVERIDKAATQVVAEGVATSKEGDAKREEIRTFALQQLEESGDIEAAHRLAGIWGMEYVYDAQALAAAAAKRRSKYIQWDEAFPEKQPPELASTPEALFHAFKTLGAGVNGEKIVYGFDVEWSDEHAGASLLQIATKQAVILVDIPALSKTEEGANALEKTVGRLFESSSTVVGFQCRQDLSQLRRSPCIREKHWFGGRHSVVELNHVVTKRKASLAQLGLSRCCEHFLGKALDKSEQCSLWTLRPLTEQQRVYAALDAWVCVAIYEKLSP
jgi:hypothetical protein